MKTIILTTTNCTKCDSEAFKEHDKDLKKVFSHRCSGCGESLYDFETHTLQRKISFEQR